MPVRMYVAIRPNDCNQAQDNLPAATKKARHLKPQLDNSSISSSGAVSRLTGVAPDTLRVWERRYGAVVPFRSDAGTRLYSREDVGRLALIKRLVDRGDAISTVANLGAEQLQERAKGAPLDELDVVPNVENHRGNAVAVVDPVDTTSVDRMLSALEQKRVVFVGETHDRYDHYLNQLSIIRGLHRRGVDLAVGMEFFQEPFQRVLDRYVAGEIGEKALLDRTSGEEVWVELDSGGKPKSAARQGRALTLL